MSDGADTAGRQEIHRTSERRFAALTVPTDLRATSLSGKGRETLLADLMQPTNFDAFARSLRMTRRTSRRRLHDEDTPFRKLLRDVRLEMAISCIRDTECRWRISRSASSNDRQAQTSEMAAD